MLSKILGLLNKIVYKLKCGNKVSFSGIPRFVSHMQIYVESGKVEVGKSFSMKEGTYIAAVNGGKITIGDDVAINRNCILVSHDSIMISDNCRIGPNVVFYDHNHRFGMNGVEDGYTHAPIVVERNCWIGAGVTVLKGTRIGEGSVIGAGVILQGDIPPHSLVTTNRELYITPIVSNREKNEIERDLKS